MSGERALLEEFRAGRCPDCGGTDFRPGPRGGLAQNIECRGCLARFNVTKHEDEVLMVQRIEREDEGGARWPPIIFRRNDRVRVIDRAGGTATGIVSQASDNGISLVVEFDYRWHGRTPLAVMWSGEDYASIVDGERVRLEPERQ